MTKEGAELGTDLGIMWEYGSIHLPKLGRQYSSMATELHRTAASETAAFKRTGGDMVALRDSWTRLRDHLQRILVETSRGLAYTGRALCQAADYYAATDAEAAEVLNETVDSRKDSHLDQPDSEVPPAPMPGDPLSDSDRPVHGPN